MALAALEGQPVLLVFMRPECGYCRQLREELIEECPQSVEGQLVVLSHEDSDSRLGPEAPEQEAGPGDCFPVLLDTTGAIFRAYGVAGVPAGYLLDPDGLVAGSATGVAGVTRLVGELEEASTSSEGGEGQG